MSNEVYHRRVLADEMVSLAKIKDKIEDAYESLERDDFAIKDQWHDCNSELYACIHKIDRVLEHADAAIELLFSKEEAKD